MRRKGSDEQAIHLPVVPMNRRGFLQAILAAGVAPYVVTTAGALVPVRQIQTLDNTILLAYYGIDRSVSAWWRSGPLAAKFVELFNAHALNERMKMGFR